MNSAKLILLDIFSYSCMNCLRSLEFVKKIDSKYKRFGLNTILIHPPEWEFEKDSKNVINAIKGYKIKFPIIMDGDKKIIKKLKINFWPTQILIRNGKIIYEHIGEGDYKELENSIVRFLKIKTKRLFNKEPEYSRLPTVYCGKKKNGKVMNLIAKLKFGVIYKTGKWIQKREYLQSIGKQNSLMILTKGNIVNFVAESVKNQTTKINIKLNDKNIKNLIINKPQLYDIVKLKNNKQNKLRITTNKNLAIYSFSFQ